MPPTPPKMDLAFVPESIKISDLKKDAFFSQNGALLAPRGHPKITKISKSASQGRTFYPFRKTSRRSQIMDPPEPSKLSWRLSKTSIFTYPPYPQNGIKMTSKNIPFGHLWAPKFQKVQKRSVSENALKNICKICGTKNKHYFQTC